MKKITFIKTSKLCSVLKQLIFILFTTIISIYSCKNNNNRKEVEKIVNEWIGKEIFFPKDISCYITGRDTLVDILNSFFQKEFKVLMYADSTGCSDCKLKLFEWKQLIEGIESLFPDKVGFLLFFQPKNKYDMIELFVQNLFDYPVFMDVNNIINRLNHFPQASQYQCFLLDKNNKVLIVGNPVLNRKIWELYKSKIDGSN